MFDCYHVWQFAPEEFLFRSGEVASEMFFVTSGAVDEVVESQVALYMIKCCLLSCHLWHFEEREQSWAQITL